MARKHRDTAGPSLARTAGKPSARSRRKASPAAVPAAAVVRDEAVDRFARRIFWAAGIAALLLLGFLCFFPVQSDDVFMYLAIGRRVMREKAFPTIDPFLFSIPNYHWHILHEWATHLIVYGLFCLGGWTLLIVAKTLMLLAAAGMALVAAWRLGVRSAVVPLLLILAAVAGYHRFIERSSLTSDFLTAAVLAIVALDRAKPGRLRYLLPFIFLAWVNLHPGFYVGLVICGLAVLWDIRRIRQRPVQIFAGCVLASALLCLVNPQGVAGITYPLQPIFDRRWDICRVYNYEWMPTLNPRYLHSIHVPAFLGLIGLCILLALTALRRRPWFEISVLALLVWLGLSAARFLTTASFALCVLAVVLVSKSWFHEAAAGPWRLPRLNIATSSAVIAVAVVCCFKIAFWGYDSLAGPRHLGGGLDAVRHPTGAADFIDRIGLETNLFNEHGFGTYLAWRWDGQRKLYFHGFVDDMDFYAHNYIGVTESREQFNRIVNEFQIGAFLLNRPDPDGLPLVYRVLLNSPEWRLVFRDDRSMLFLRTIPQNEAAFARGLSAQ
ncbi:MAG TPA: hypothetical protein VMV94_08155 [Phycisphaerae bacterium]|nr:hypothetical protein [Phycisphaerae bacterium]